MSDNGNLNGTETGKPEERTFTQADVDRILTERLARVKEQYADYPALKDQAQKWAEFQEAQKSELQRLQEAVSRAETEKSQALERANQVMIQAAFVSAASAAGVAHPEDAFALAEKRGVSIEEGKVTGVTEAVKALVDAGRLPLANRPKAPDLGAGAGSGERSQERKPELTDEERHAAQRMGVKPEVYAAMKAAKE